MTIWIQRIMVGINVVFMWQAKNIYNAGGQKTFIKLWKGLKKTKKNMTDEQFAFFLDKKVSGEVAKVQTIG